MNYAVRCDAARIDGEMHSYETEIEADCMDQAYAIANSIAREMNGHVVHVVEFRGDDNLPIWPT